MRKLFTSIFLLGSFILSAQGIKGTVINSAGKPIEFATVSLNSVIDSTLVKGEITDENGAYIFGDVPFGQYYIESSYIGYETFRTKTLVYESKVMTADAIQLDLESKMLDEIIVKAKKPLIEIQADKTILNTDASISAAGSNGLDLLRKAPGVTIDNNENIQLKGKNGVSIYVDGKPSYLNAQELANLLKGMTAADIEAIEIITNPSAKFDAQGNAGIINLRLRKNKNFGTNGNLNASLGYGKYHKSYLGVNLNNRNNRLNTFGSFGIGNDKNYNELNLYREQNNAVFDQKQSQTNTEKPLNAKLGLDYYANNEHTFGVLANINTQYGDKEYLSTSQTKISSQITPIKIDSILNASNNIMSKSINANFNLNYRFADTLGNELTVDLDRGLYDAKSNSMQPNMYLDGSTNALIAERTFANNTPSHINIYTAKADYNKTLKSINASLSFGAKFANVNTDNTFDFFNVLNGVSQKDVEQSNQFNYTEEVSAAYVNLTGLLGKQWNYQAGLRYENTHSIGDLTRDPSLPTKPQDYTERRYGNLFPSGALTYNINQNNTINLTYSKRINRPNYEDLNPFEWRLDELSFRKGNPFLKPQYNDNLELSYTVMQAATIGLAYSNSVDVVTDIVENDVDQPNKSFINYRNLANQKQYALSINSPLPIKSWWNGYLSFTLYKSFFKARFPEYTFDVSTPIATNVYMEHNFSLQKGFDLSVSGWFNSASIWGGSWLTEPQGSLDLGIKKNILGNKASIKLAVTDILHTAPWASYSDAIPGLKIRGSGLWESQRVNLNFNYRFGNSEVKSARQRKTGLEDESGRIKG